MEKNKKYILILFIISISFLGVTFLPVEDIFRGIISLPGVGALTYALYQLWRDENKHERNLFLQNKQQDFILSTSSHIAEVSYDKHVLFCEEYIQRIQDGRKELFRDGATPETINFGADLVQIRQKHAAWLTDDIEEGLKPFEQVLIEIGAKENYLRRTEAKEMNNIRKEVVEKIYRSLGLVLGHEKPENDKEAELHIDKVIDKIRDILGIKEMTKLRIKATSVALDRLE